jgi:hypothetical protein
LIIVDVELAVVIGSAMRTLHRLCRSGRTSTAPIPTVELELTAAAEQQQERSCPDGEGSEQPDNVDHKKGHDTASFAAHSARIG